LACETPIHQDTQEVTLLTANASIRAIAKTATKTWAIFWEQWNGMARPLEAATRVPLGPLGLTEEVDVSAPGHTCARHCGCMLDLEGPSWVSPNPSKMPSAMAHALDCPVVAVACPDTPRTGAMPWARSHGGCPDSASHRMQYTYPGMIDLVLWRIFYINADGRIPLTFDGRSMVANYKNCLVTHVMDASTNHVVLCPWPGCHDRRRANVVRNCLLKHLVEYNELLKDSIQRPAHGGLAGYESRTRRPMKTPAGEDTSTRFRLPHSRTASDAPRRRADLDAAAPPSKNIWVAGSCASNFLTPQLARLALSIYPHYTQLVREYCEWELQNLMEADHAYWDDSSRLVTKAAARYSVAAWRDRVAGVTTRTKLGTSVFKTGEALGTWSLERRFRDANGHMWPVRFGPPPHGRVRKLLRPGA
jgi:hypothetical protein